MRESWRWFGDSDSVSLDEIRQAGARDVVCALYDIPAGEVWPLKSIQQLKERIERTDVGQTQLRWTVVESIPIHDDIKLGRPGRDERIDAWATTLQNLARCGIEVVCYNFMPVLDWTRTDLQYPLPTGARTLRFDFREYAVFDLYILCREGAENEYSQQELEQAKIDYAAMSIDAVEQLSSNIIKGLPGSMAGRYDIESFRQAISYYRDNSRQSLEACLDYFLSRVLPVAEKYGLKLAIHPDDPPWQLFGLPRIMCTSADIERLLARHSSIANGITLCTGTFGSCINNDVSDMAKRFSDRIYFAHLRNIVHDADESRSFTEANHLEGAVNIVDVVSYLLEHEASKSTRHQGYREVCFRPDHGHQMLDDLNKSENPGYSAIGRLKGLAEVRGVIQALLNGR